MPKSLPVNSGGLPAPARVLAYGRVSGQDLEAGKNEQHADRLARLDEQLARIDAYAVAMDWPKPVRFKEIESGGEKYDQASQAESVDDFLSRPRGTHRKEQRKLLEQLKPGDVVVVVKDDRWSRDGRFDQDIEDLIRHKGAVWHSIEEPHLWSSPSLVKGVTRLQKEEYRNIVRHNMVGARQRQRDEGQYTEGLPPFGYQRAARVGTKLTDRLLHPSPHASLVTQAFARCVRGESIATIATWLRSKGLQGRGGRPRTWSKKDVGNMLRSRVYLGEIRNSKDEWIKAGHERLVDAGTFARAQEALTSRRLGGPGRQPGDDKQALNANWVLKGIADCAHCGRRMGSVYKQNRRGVYSAFYYGCNGRLARRGCLAAYVPVDAADEFVSQLALDYLKSQRHHLVAKCKPSAPAPLDFVAARKKLMARRGRILDMFEAGDITGAERKAKLEKVTNELTALDAQEASQHAVTQTLDPQRRAGLLAELGALEKAWTGLTPVKRRAVIQRLASTITLDASGEKQPVKVQWFTPEELMLRRTA